MMTLSEKLVLIDKYTQIQQTLIDKAAWDESISPKMVKECVDYYEQLIKELESSL